MKKLIATLKNEDWVIVYAGAIILLLATLFPEFMPSMPKKLESLADLSKAGFMFVSILGLTYLCQAVLRRPMKGIFLSLLTIFVLSLAAQVVANIPLIKTWGAGVGILLGNFRSYRQQLLRHTTVAQASHSERVLH